MTEQQGILADIQGNLSNFRFISMVDKPLYRLKNLQNENLISIYKNEFQIGRSTSK